MTAEITVVNIGYGRHLFQESNPELERMKSCAKEVEHLHAIIFTRSSDGFDEKRMGNNLTLHPTNSSSKFSMLFDAYKIGKSLISGSENQVVVYAQDPFETGLIGYWLKRKFSNKVRFIVQEHADAFSLDYWKKESILNRIRFQVGLFILKRTDKIRVVSERIKNTLQSLNISTPIVQLAVAVEGDSLIQYRDIPSQNNNPDTFEFLSVCRFVPQKNLILMVDAFKEVYEHNPEVRLRLVGSGPQEQVVDEYIKKSFPTENCPITRESWSDSVPELMNNADAYLLTSNYEGWGRVLIESLLVGLPIVTTDVGCAGEVVKDGEHGFVVPVGGKSELVDSMREMVNNKSLYSEMVSNISSLPINRIPGTDVESYGVLWAQTLN